MNPRLVTTLAALTALWACAPDSPEESAPPADGAAQDGPGVEERLAMYTPVRLTADLSQLSDNQRRMIGVLIDAAREMDAIYWMQAYGPRDSLLASVDDADTRRLIEINYGPWDRLREDEPFVASVGPKPPGANFYPADMTKEEFDAAVAEGGDRAEALRSQYTIVRRAESGELVAIPYHEAYAEPLGRAAEKLREAARLAEDPGFERYLRMRADALLSDDFQPSDLAWMDMKDNDIDVVIGPIETYEDQLFGTKTANEGYVLIKDQEWSRRLAHYIELLPELQRGLPVEAEFKQETPGAGSDLNAYDAVYYAGQANAGAKTIAINLPNDEQVQLEKGTRRLQLKNAMRAKFDEILTPIAGELIAADQQANVTFDAFFQNTMFHEVAHGLGIKNTIDGRGTVREALRERASGLEEEKADVLGVYMVTQLTEAGELPREELLDNYVTFLAGLFRSVRFGASDAHGVANMATFNFLSERDGFSRDDATGGYRVHLDEMRSAIDELAGFILRLQGNGDYEGVSAFMDENGVIRPALATELERLTALGIPVDIVFEQGPAALGLR